MKNLMTLIGLALIVFNTTVSAQSFDNDLEMELFNYNQVGKINAAMLNDIDAEINRVKVKFDVATDGLDAGYDIVEGKILAAMIISIEDQLAQVEELRDQLNDKYEVLDADKAAIDKKLQGIQVLINEL